LKKDVIPQQPVPEGRSRGGICSWKKQVSNPLFCHCE